MHHVDILKINLESVAQNKARLLRGGERDWNGACSDLSWGMKRLILSFILEGKEDLNPRHVKRVSSKYIKQHLLSDDLDLA